MACESKKLTITVSRATGHCVQANECAYCVVEANGVQRKTGTGRCATAGSCACQWGEALEFPYTGGTPRALHVEVHGLLARGEDKLVGLGNVNLLEVLERGTKQVVEVPLMRDGSCVSLTHPGHQEHAGEVHLACQAGGRCLASALSGPAQALSQLFECTGAHASSTAKPGLAALWQQQLSQSGAAGTGVPSAKPSSSAAQRLLQLSQQHDTLAAGNFNFHHQLTAKERLARIEMLLQQGLTEETVQHIIKRSKGGPYMQSASEGAAILAVLRERGCSDADMNLLLQLQRSIFQRAASSVSDVFAALDDMLQLSMVKTMQVCLRQPSLLTRDSDTLRQRWAWLKPHYGLSETAVASLAKRMVNSRAVCALLTYSQETITARLSGLQHVIELSDAEVIKLFPYLTVLLEADPEQHIRPRWDLYQSLLGEFTPADKRRFIMSPDTLRLPEHTIRNVFSGVEQLMGSTATAQHMLRLSPQSFHCGVERLATNLRALQQLYGCSSQQAQKVLVRTPQIANYKLEAPKFQCRVAAVTEWYGHASPAAMLLARNCGPRLWASMWKLGARMAFIRRLRMERAAPELNTSMLANSTQQFCRAVRVSEEKYAAFEQRWLVSPEAAELCRHEGPPRVKIIGAPGAALS
ncbi:hypothetical protein D9Q98_010636 [Chlorella vulgaris]|uniref:C2 domain-containing protein n=1 Tax=Chlorella vulgaris TaxID=3077 RepID=A0A9D4TEK6_CHLVU|nr:hypothetical protein D9Q98_010636 [Chlorella vulgaris]